MDITPETAAQYKVKFDRLTKQYLKEFDDFSAVGFCEWLAHTKIGLSAATFRMYRAATLYCISQEYLQDLDRCQDFLQGFSSNNKHQLINRKKRKGYSESEFAALLEYTANRIVSAESRTITSWWWENLHYTLKATSLTGLRPVEWASARVERAGDTCNLIVVNAKHTHGRAHGETRTINISDLTDSEKADIQKKIELTATAISHGYSSSMTAYQRRIGKYLLEANNAVFPNATETIAVYSSRHQVVSEYKSTEGSTIEGLAAILGHKSTETASKHYGRKAKPGKLKPSKIKADSADLARVAALNAGRDAAGPAKKTPPTPHSPSH